VSETKTPRDADANEISSRLIAGLKSCKSVVENYRAMLSGNEIEEASNSNAPESNSLREAR
jgi:hypothetical protein